MIRLLTVIVQSTNSDPVSWQIALGLFFDLVGAILLVGVESNLLQQGLFAVDKQTNSVIQARNKIENGATLTEDDSEFDPFISAVEMDSFQNDTGQEDLEVTVESVEVGDSDIIGDAPYVVTLCIQDGGISGTDSKKFSRDIIQQFLESRVQSRFAKSGTLCILAGFSIQFFATIWPSLTFLWNLLSI